MNTYFNINYEFDRERIHETIAERLTREGSDYICVADGVILNIANRQPDYLEVVNGSMFSICDSSYVPLYLKWIYGINVSQYCGSQIFHDIIASRKYRMIFLGAQQATLNGLQQNLLSTNPDVADMKFVELPFCRVEDFDYPAIAHMVDEDGADIVWVALGAPKQETFMALLKPHLHHGVMLGVGAAFKFFSGGVDTKRAPQWMVNNHLEFVHRISQEPRKQFQRCFDIVRTLPALLYGEWHRKQQNNHTK